MSIAFIGIKSCTTFWTECIKNIISFGQQDQKQCYYALMILKNLALLFDSLIFDKRTNAAVGNYFREQLGAVLEFLNLILSNPSSVAPECYDLTFSTGKYWSEFSTKTFVPHEGYMKTLFDTLNKGEEKSLKAIKILRKLLSKSKYINLI